MEVFAWLRYSSFLSVSVVERHLVPDPGSCHFLLALVPVSDLLKPLARCCETLCLVGMVGQSVNRRSGTGEPPSPLKAIAVIELRKACMGHAEEDRTDVKKAAGRETGPTPRERGGRGRGCPGRASAKWVLVWRQHTVRTKFGMLSRGVTTA